MTANTCAVLLSTSGEKWTKLPSGLRTRMLILLTKELGIFFYQTWLRGFREDVN